ncbi:MAG TPA: acyl-CoA dehydrogenase family protein [Acidimicrobiales bacterium]|nr:acyl-CoA dehydrogenase family protein [Acidimicrobiales bacterium]
MSSIAVAAPPDPLHDVRAYAAELDAWLAGRPACLGAVTIPIPSYARRVGAMAGLMGALHDAGWSRYGWPVEVGGLGGSILHRAAMWEALARHGVPGMALFEHLEILAPTLVATGPQPFVAEALPEFLAGRQLWAQGFSEPGAGSDLASLRTTARPTGDGFVVNGRKIWTSWARYATWCLLLARTGTRESRHRGLTALVVDLRDPGVEVRPIEQANGTDELAEVAFDDVVVPADRLVGEVDGGWRVAMHILSHERGTFAWFRHCFLYQHLLDRIDHAAAGHDAALGHALLDLAAVTASGHAGLEAHATGVPLGPLAAFPKLLLCAAEQSVYDWVLATDPDLAVDAAGDDVAVRRQEYLFSRIVTVYGGSQQMQLETIAKQLLRLP